MELKISQTVDEPILTPIRQPILQSTMHKSTSAHLEASNDIKVTKYNDKKIAKNLPQIAQFGAQNFEGGLRKI